MVVGLDPEGRFDHVPTSDRNLPPEKRTTFHLRLLTDAEHGRAMPILKRMEANPDKAASQMTEVIRAGLVGWTNLPDRYGEPIEFRTGPEMEVLGTRRPVIADDVLCRIPSFALKAELVGVIAMGQEPTPDEVGN